MLTFVAYIMAYMRSVFNNKNQFHPTSKGNGLLVHITSQQLNTIFANSTEREKPSTS